MMTYRFYVGADNRTGEVALLRLKGTLVFHPGVTGFTLWRAEGYWQGSREDTAVVEIVADDRFDAQGLKAELEADLAQQCVFTTGTRTFEITPAAAVRPAA